MPVAFDLQSHSTHSDGALPPREVVQRAAAAGIGLLALTDHDSTAGVDEALAAGAEHGVRVVPAAELSTIDGDHEDLHVCAYGIDHHAPAWTAALEAFRADRAARADRMLAALQENGWAVDDTEVRRRQREGSPVGRPHLAQAAFGHPDNAERIAREGLADFGDLLVAELIPGAPSYRRRTTPTVGEAVALVHEAGGVAIWAHPFWDLDTPEEVLATVDRFAGEHGLDGVEVFYATHTREETLLLADHCEARGLLTTGSADFHGPDHPHFSRFGAFETYGRTPRLGPIGG